MIGNRNTGKIHYPDCSAVKMMNRDHKITIHDDVVAAAFSPCAWCHGPRERMERYDPHRRVEPCTDPRLRERMKDQGCSCGSHYGTVLMYPHYDGILVDGRDGLWWVFFKCYECGTQSSHRLLPETFAHKILGGFNEKEI